MIAYIVILTILNLIRGGMYNINSRRVTCGLGVILITSLLTTPLEALAIGLGWFIGATFGWGQYFSTFTGIAQSKPEVKLIDFLAKPFAKVGAKTQGLASMSLRGVLWLFFPILFLSIVRTTWSEEITLSLASFYFLPLGLLMGLWYWSVRFIAINKILPRDILQYLTPIDAEGHKRYWSEVETAELLWGLTLGYILWSMI